MARKDDRRHGVRYNLQDAHVSRGYCDFAVSIYDLDKISLLAAGSMSYRSYYSNVLDAKCWLTTLFTVALPHLLDERWRVLCARYSCKNNPRHAQVASPKLTILLRRFSYKWTYASRRDFYCGNAKSLDDYVQRLRKAWSNPRRKRILPRRNHGTSYKNHRCRVS